MAVVWPCSLVPSGAAQDFANAEKVANAADFIFKSIHDKAVAK